METLHWMIDCIQSVTDLPIAVDSPSADVLTQAYKFCNKPGLINSVSGEGDKIDKIFPILAENKCIDRYDCLQIVRGDRLQFK